MKLDVFVGGKIRRAHEGKRDAGAVGRDRERSQGQPVVRADAVRHPGDLPVARVAGIRIKREVRGIVHGRSRQRGPAPQRPAVRRASIVDFAGPVGAAHADPVRRQFGRSIEILGQQERRLFGQHQQNEIDVVRAVLVFRGKPDRADARRLGGPDKRVGQRR